ncbi:MAG: helix-turn-helix domain-containing protein [Alphaproteobacteria bacterium]
MSLFQRITMPFGEPEEDESDRSAMRNEAGERLRERRQQLGLDLESVAEALCIKPVYLAAIEQGRTDELPGTTYAIGFIRAYATYLGLDGERVLDSYREETADAQARPDLTLPVPLDERGVPGGRVLLAGLVLALLGYGAWYYVSTGERERPERVAEVPAELQKLTAQPPPAQALAGPAGAPATGTAANRPASSAVPPAAQPANAARGEAAASQFSSGLLTSPQPAGSAAAPDSPQSPPAPPGGAAPAGAAGPAAPGSGGAAESAAAGRPEPRASAAAAPSGSIDIRALADSWVQIRDADQGVVFARVLKTGETYRVPRSGLILRTGNAGALQVLVDGKPAPALGALGTLRRNVTLEPDALRAGTAVRG